MIARVAAIAALVGAVVLVVLILFGGGSSYTVTAEFQDAGGLVTGNQVLMGPATVGTVRSISLTSNGQAEVVCVVGLMLIGLVIVFRWVQIQFLNRQISAI